MGHDSEPLTAQYKTQRPPWIGLWSSREYTGRPDWWKENGAQDPVVRNEKLRMYRARYREEDPDWFDPKVPDGTSLSGPLGLDSKKYKNITKKADQPGDLKEFQEKVFKGSHQYKAIVEKFNLSKEHPGFDVNPTLNDLVNSPVSQLGRNAIIPNSWYHFGPRFFDSPLNENAHMKGFAAAKYAAILLAPYTLLEMRAMSYAKNFELNKGPDYKDFLKRYAKLAPLPLSVAFAWGFTLSAASTLRNRDDVYNHFYASAAVGTVVASMRSNVSLGITSAVLTTILGVFWQYQRVSETGLQGMTTHSDSAGIWGGPLLWKIFQHGDRKVPNTHY
ncbi:unnamed protein product [Caenorhabditis auriculariae]|uniref:Uncharacterized protein n=1 Tax=Caenorhabditis auriculariae TaxID=2777116 RepID=A0A8S1HX31_9PELO|nr:unnamed protein product [Caenorhabditis auriculariae]